MALLLAVQITRNAAVAAFATSNPAAAARFWPGNPSVEISGALVEIARAARERRSINQRAFAMINDAARQSPLSAEPFIVHGVQLQTAGNAGGARRAFLAAQRRDPRSMSAAYFMANNYLRTGHVLEGLEQIALLARLSSGTEILAPFVATYAQDPANWAQIRALFRSQEGLEDSVLTELAHNARNVDAILALADANHRKSDRTWLRVLLDSLVTSGDYAKARALWLSIGTGHAGDLLYDADFSAPQAPPPFNWSLTSSTVGVAERQPGKRLHVIFYGNEDGVLARQLLLLSAGPYRLRLNVVGVPAHPELLRWSVRCDESAESFAGIGLGETSTRAWTFAVPSNCRAQWLELSGRSGDVALQSDVTIEGLKLTHAGGNV